MPKSPHFDSIDYLGNTAETPREAQLPGLIELADCPKNLSCGKSKPGQVTAAEAFYLCDSADLKCSELARGGVFDTSERIEQHLARTRDEVKLLEIRESSALQKKNVPANFRIELDGTIKEIRDPNRKMMDFDPVMSIEMVNGEADSGREYTEKQKAALRQLVSYVQTNWSENIQLDESTQDPKSRIVRALYVDPVYVDSDVDGTISDSNCHGWKPLPKPEPRRHFWEKEHWHLFDSSEGRKCGEYDRVDQMTGEDRDKFIDRVKRLISRNEGGYNTIALNDNGYGISVGIAQWNQKKGELPKLFRAWYDAAEAENDGQLSELFKGWRNAAEKDLREKPADVVANEGKPNRFEEIFGIHAQTLLDEKKVREYPFTDDTAEAKDMMDKLRKALDEPLFRRVQDELVRNNVRRAINLAHSYGHHSVRFIAQVADVANQYGWNGCESFLRKANVANIPEDIEGECMAIQAFIDNTPPKTNTKTGEPIYRTERDKRLDKEFPPKNQSGLRLMTKYVF